jgi:hypothetical protein
MEVLAPENSGIFGSLWDGFTACAETQFDPDFRPAEQYAAQTVTAGASRSAFT